MDHVGFFLNIQQSKSQHDLPSPNLIMTIPTWRHGDSPATFLGI